MMAPNRPAIALSLVLSAAATAQDPSLVFTPVTAEAGIQWAPATTETRMGAGAAFLDYDRDGWQDILLVGSFTRPALYRNLGDGTFEDVSGSTGVRTVPGDLETMCVTVGDPDGDGDPDLYIGRRGSNYLLENRNGVFYDITPPVLRLPWWTCGAAFGDYDGDGLLDLYVANYIVGQPNFPFHIPAPNFLIKNLGGGVWEDRTPETGVGGAGTTLATAWSDVDADGDLDLWVGNDFGSFIEPNCLYRNDGPDPSDPRGWQFTEIAEEGGADAAIYCMGITAGDWDRDQDLDYYFTNLGRNVFLRNDGDCSFVDITDELDVGATLDPFAIGLLATSWGTGFRDFDCDGWLDLYVGNGHIPADASIANGLFTPNMVYHHQGESLEYREVGIEAGLGDGGQGRGTCFADYDRDGDVDVLQVNVLGAPVLYRNDSPRRGRWLEVQLYGLLGQREALGARLTAQTREARLLREVVRNDSFESSSDLGVHFGLGTAPLEALDIRWPSGTEQRLEALEPNMRWLLFEPRAVIEGAEISAEEGQASAQAFARIRNRTEAPLQVLVVAQYLMDGQPFGIELVDAPRLPPGGFAAVSTLLPRTPTRAEVPEFGRLEVRWSVTDFLALDQRSVGIEEPR